MTCTAGSRRQGAVLAFSLLPFPRLSAPFAQPNSPFRAAPAANRQVRSGDDGAKPRPARLERADARGGCRTGSLPVSAEAAPELPCDWRDRRIGTARGRDVPRGAAARVVLLGKKGRVGTRRQIIGEEGAQLGGGLLMPWPKLFAAVATGRINPNPEQWNMQGRNGVHLGC